jgi:hypothetical protein
MNENVVLKHLSTNQLGVRVVVWVYRGEGCTFPHPHPFLELGHFSKSFKTTSTM